MLHSICQHIWKTQQWPQDWKSRAIPKKHSAKECSNYHTVALISHANKIMLKLLQARLQQYVNWQLSYVQAGLNKSRGASIGSPTSNRSQKKHEFQKNICICLIDYAKAFDCVDHNQLENSSRDRNTRPPDLPLEKSVHRSRGNS